MARGVYEIRRARKDTACSECQYHTIRKGERYLYGSMPPEHECNDSGKWYIVRACLRCAEEFGLHNSDTRKTMAEVSCSPHNAP